MAIRQPTVELNDDPLWYKDAIFYQIHVRAFADGNEDGKGDFIGLTERLDYLQDLGVTALWLLPFYPSPLRDDGYDIADYTDIHPAYGTLDDFKRFLDEAHRRGLRVITELVINHTSDQHPWFQQSRRAAPDSTWRDFYVWSDTPDKYQDARIIFQDFESSNWSWDPVAEAYYWHRFFSHQPDLNYDNPAVHDAIFKAMDFWLDMGVDGLRLDAIPYLYERERTTCENLPETHAFLKKLRAHVDEKYENRMLLAEANQWPEDAVEYFGDGDECHMAFNFPVMPRLYMAVRMEDNFPIIDILQQTPEIPDNCQWATFLRNHDELTLEMVTDEERDYMYRMYARDPQARINLGIRRRLAPLMDNDRRKIELMNCLLFALPGSPVVYYGDEIGMGDNIYLGDRNSVRTPMQWSIDRNAGFSQANPQRLYLPLVADPEYHYEALNVEIQQNNPHSLLWWMRRTIAVRKRFKAFGRGEFEFISTENNKILAFTRRYEDEVILVVANLSRIAQYVELDLSDFQDWSPVELSGRTEFPPIEDSAYPLLLGAFAFYWFVLQPQEVEEPTARRDEARVPTIAVAGEFHEFFRGTMKQTIEAALPAFLNERRWFGGKARTIRRTEIGEVIRVTEDAVITLVHVDYMEGESETYVLPLTYAMREEAYQVQQDSPRAVVARLEWADDGGEDGVLYDALWNETFTLQLLDIISHEGQISSMGDGTMFASKTPAFDAIVAEHEEDEPPPPRVLSGEQSNTSVAFNNTFVLKLFRRMEEGINPDLEIGRFLTERTSFASNPPVAGALEYRRNRTQPASIAVLHGFVQNQGNAWEYTLNAMGRYLEQVLTHPGEDRLQPPPLPDVSLVRLADRPPTELAEETIGAYLESAYLIGKRTGELHLALASATDDPDFRPASYTQLQQRPLYQSIRNMVRQSLRLLRRRRSTLPDEVRPEANEVLNCEDDMLQLLSGILDRELTAKRIRCHGDYHLGQVLYTGKDFVITDFEGEPARTLKERRRKRSALRDVAGMLRSFHYAAYTALFDQEIRGVEGLSLTALEAWTRYWYRWVGAQFLCAYLETAGTASFMPDTRDELQVLLDAFLMEKAAYELDYELNNRPEWVKIPLRGLLQPVQTNNRSQ